MDDSRGCGQASFPFIIPISLEAEIMSDQVLTIHDITERVTEAFIS